MESTTGDKIILQIVPTIAENVLEYFEGETVMKWKNLLLKRLEDQDICIWQQIDTSSGLSNLSNAKGKIDLNANARSIDPSLFLPQVDAIVLFYEIRDKATLVEWLKVVVNDIRLKNITPMVIGCYQKGESTKEFREQFMSDNDPRFFLWRVDNEGSGPEPGSISSDIEDVEAEVGQDVEVSEDIVDIYQRILTFMLEHPK